MKYYTYQLPHGWNSGILNKSGVCPTIDACIAFWHILLVEEYEYISVEISKK